MNSNRLIAMASLIKKNSLVLDVGTDHAYLPIIIIKKKISDHVYASDISSKALINAQKNIDKHGCSDRVMLFEADGLNGIPKNYDTIVISGMGTSTIKRILANVMAVQRIILSSNNDYYELRLFMQQIGYKIEKEIVVKENNRYYPIISYTRGHEKLSNSILYFGNSHNVDYYSFLIETYKKLLNLVNIEKQQEIQYKIKMLLGLLKECG